jgi:pimeloyl-ACP methyl ester carboxylesterase
VEPIALGGVTQWIARLGEPSTKPVLLWIHGGPGLAETPWLRRFAGPLTERFRVVSWDQRGSGKSWSSAEPHSDMTVGRLVEDTLELSGRLATEDSARRIVLVGHSLGGAVAAMAAARRPDLYRGVVLAAPLARGADNDRISLDLVRE